MKQIVTLIFRRLLKDKLTTSISVAGLIISLSIVSIVLLFIVNDFNYNKSFSKSERLCRVINHDPQSNTTWGQTPFQVGEFAEKDISEVESYVREYRMSNIYVKSKGEYVNEPECIGTEASFFSLFDVDLISGSIVDFESDNYIAISERVAQKYFGDVSPLNKVFDIRYKDREKTFTVKAVYSNFLDNSTVKPDIITNIDFAFDNLLASLKTTDKKMSEQKMRQAWKQGIFFTNYLLLADGANWDSATSKLEAMGYEYAPKEAPVKLDLQPFESIFFESQNITDSGSVEKGNRMALYILAALGLIILLIACINYLNLALAQALNQTKSFAVSRICGSPRWRQVFELMLESITVALISIPFAIVVAHYVLPYMTQLFGKSYSLSFFSISNIKVLLYLGAVAVVVGLLSGVIVAMKFLSMDLIVALKSEKANINRRNRSRYALIVFQLTAFIVLLSAMFVIKQQVSYSYAKDIGFSKEGVVRLDLGDKSYSLFKEKAAAIAGVNSVSGALWIPPNQNQMVMTLPKVSNPTEMVEVRGLFTDYGFASTLGMTLLKGNDFEQGKVQSGVLVNESAVKALGLSNVVGERTAFGEVIGLVKDFNIYSVREKIPPMVIGLNPGMTRVAVLSINSENMVGVVDQLKQVWKSMDGISPFDPRFTDDALDQLYQQEKKTSEIIGVLAFVAIFIACMGLWGLSIIAGKQREKEIGVRKVNGAKIIEVITLLNKDFVVCVLVAFVLAVPLSFFLMSKWLHSYAFHTQISWFTFIFSGITALTITLLTITFQAYRSASRNPVKALRYE